jgi:hypothetical protein
MVACAVDTLTNSDTIYVLYLHKSGIGIEYAYAYEPGNRVQCTTRVGVVVVAAHLA